MWNFERGSATFAVVIFAILTMYQTYNLVYVDKSEDYIFSFIFAIVMFLLYSIQLIMVFRKKQNKNELIKTNK
ncbi:hypothetical protein [Bacillus sp. Brlt_9]|uniref:hypothetical protein n=1 Tax=Bacillus sp. Brlt_9 TaxID=3110916 RepID=UPI003F7C10B1